MIVNKDSLPNLFSYDSYRKYLRDTYESLKAKDRNFSFRFFARVAGFSSPNFLHLVMEGKRNLSQDGASKISKALKHSREESGFFKTLVALNQSKTAAESSKYVQALFRYKTFREAKPLAEAQFQYFSQWYCVPIRELVATQGFREDPEWIASRISPPITKEEAQSALDLLLSLGLLKKDEHGRLSQTDTILSTGDQVHSTAVARWHQKALELASQSIDRYPSSEREIAAFVAGLTPEGMKKAVEVLRKVRKELWTIAQADDGKGTDVFQFSLQLIPLTRATSNSSAPEDK